MSISISVAKKKYVNGNMDNNNISIGRPKWQREGGNTALLVYLEPYMI